MDNAIRSRMIQHRACDSRERKAGFGYSPWVFLVFAADEKFPIHLPDLLNNLPGNQRPRP